MIQGNTGERLRANSFSQVRAPPHSCAPHLPPPTSPATAPLTQTHVPGFVANAEALRKLGVEHVFCVSVNDPFVMGAWSADLGCEGKVTMLADTNAEFVTSIGMAQDLAALGGVRSKRFALIVEGGKVTHVGIDVKGIDATSAESMLKQLGGC